MTSSTDDRPLSLLTFNLDYNPETIATRIAAAAESVAELSPDVVCLQEVLFDGTGNTAEVVAAAAGLTVAGVVEYPLSPAGVRTGAAILAREPARNVHVLDLPCDIMTRGVVATELSTPAGRDLLVLSGHLAWGGYREATRRAEAMRVVKWADELASALDDPVVVWAGDFNTVPQSSTIRFLTGLEAHDELGTYWVDAFAMAGHGDGITSSSTNPWVGHTARIVGIERPELLPDRRIDYVLVRGWVYGRPGCPLSASVVCTAPAGPEMVVPSDHYGLLTTLWDPPVRPAGEESAFLRRARALEHKPGRHQAAPTSSTSE